MMAFFLIEGFQKTTHIKKYLGRLFIFAVVSQIPYFWANNYTPWFFPLNVMFLLFLGLLMVHLHEKIQIRWLFWVLFIIFMLISLTMEWGFIGIIAILMYKIIKNENKRRFWPPFTLAFINISFGFLALGFVALLRTLAASPEFADLAELGLEGFSFQMASLLIFFGIGHLLAGFLLKRYNNQRGKSMKYLFYVIYPLHFAILGLIAHLLNIR